jgi:hypothetical protein
VRGMVHVRGGEEMRRSRSDRGGTDASFGRRVARCSRRRPGHCRSLKHLDEAVGDLRVTRGFGRRASTTRRTIDLFPSRSRGGAEPLLVGRTLRMATLADTGALACARIEQHGD